MSEVIVPAAESGVSAGGYNSAAAFKSVGLSLLVNGVMPFVTYKVLVSHFHPGSIMPLLYATVFPVLGLVVGLVRTRVIDVIAILALFGLSYSVATTLLAGEVHLALILGATQGFVVASAFLVSALIKRPVIFFISRQFIAGNDPVSRARFAAVNELDGGRTFFIATMVWVGGILFMSTASLGLAFILAPATYLLVNNVINTGTNILLVIWSFRFVRLRLEPLRDKLPAAA